MRLNVLGSAGWMPSDGRETACYALRDDDRMLVLDAGTGLRRLVTDPALLSGVVRVDVVLSHFHLDHVVGLSYLSAVSGATDVAVHGPGSWLYGRATRDILDDLVGSPRQPTSLHANGMGVQDMEPGGLTWADHRVRYRHQPTHTSPSVAIRVDDALTYCTDTAYDEDNAAFARGSHLLLHEAWTGDMTGHSTPRDAAMIAELAGVEDLVLIHVAPTADVDEMRYAAADVFPRCIIAYDGQEIAHVEVAR